MSYELATLHGNLVISQQANENVTGSIKLQNDILCQIDNCRIPKRLKSFFTCVLEFENGKLHALPNAVLEPNLASQSSILNLKNNDTMFQYLMVLLTEGER